MDQNLKRQIIMEHYSYPKNRKRTEDKNYQKIISNNVSCIDNIDIYVKLNNNIIEDICFDGEACAISISSTSILITNLIGKTINEALNYINEFEKMLNELPYNENILKEAICYDDIYKQSNRKNCAFLPYKGLKKLLEDNVK